MAVSINDVHVIPHFTYVWTIENMYACRRVASPTFKVQAMEKTDWYLSLDKNNNSGFIQLQIKLYSAYNVPNAIEINFELSFLAINGRPLIKKLCSKKIQRGDIFEFTKFADIDEVFVQKRTEFLPGDVLTVRCRMWRTGNEISKHEVCFAHTLLREFRGSCLLKICDFSTLRVGQNGEITLNPTSGETIPMTLNCFIREEDDEQYVCIDIWLIDPETPCDGKIKILLLDAKGNVVHSEKAEIFHSYKQILDFFEKRRLTESKATLLPDDVLNLRCEYEMVAKTRSGVENYQYINLSKSEDSTSEIGKKRSYLTG
ncbi:unnamed protein product [Larinioides sclopetarius]|uniref:MATH domain-containing protein n=1 Tax=Larinioides sclopetarius TaxID=280406 RepID=A0AAV1ZW07_9ARAC